MEIRDTRVLILGGSGLVGMAIARRMLRHLPARLTITALTKNETDEGFAELKELAVGNTEIARNWGDVMVATEFKDEPRRELVESPEKRRVLLDDIYGPFGRERLERFFLYRLLMSTMWSSGTSRSSTCRSSSATYTSCSRRCATPALSSI
jgi:hypothetical protein